MNIADRIGEEKHPASCRDKGRGWVDVGALCLSSVGDDSSASPHGTRTNHVLTRTSTRPPPFSTSTPCPYRTGAGIPFHSPMRSAIFIRMGADVFSHAQIRVSKIIRTRLHIITSSGCLCLSVMRQNHQETSPVAHYDTIYKRLNGTLVIGSIPIRSPLIVTSCVTG